MDIATNATEVTEDESGSHVNDNSVFTFKEHQGKLAHCLRISIQLWTVCKYTFFGLLLVCGVVILLVEIDGFIHVSWVKLPTAPKRSNNIDHHTVYAVKLVSNKIWQIEN